MARHPTRIGRYDLVTALATGGMGRIFLGRASGVGGFERKVVIKTLEAPHGADSDPSVAMFLDEARTLGLLHHQHIASVFEVGRDDDGRYYMVLEYLDGYSAHDVWERAVQFGAALPLDFSLTVVSAAANALHYTHTRKGLDGTPLGIVHRDVTPSNVMIGHDGSVKLIDYGIAWTANRTTKTQTGFVKGKVGYLSPEQVSGREVDARTDVFALGILLYELTTLTRAFRDGSDLSTMQRIKQGRVARPTQLVSEYPPELEAIVMKALQVDPRDRFSDADSMRRAVEGIGHRLRFVLGDAAVIEVMSQLYEGGAIASNQSPGAEDPAFDWVESDHDLTVRRDPKELVEAMRAEIRRNAAITPAPLRSRKLRAATEAVDALIDQNSDLSMAFPLIAPPTPPVGTPVVDRPIELVTRKPAEPSPAVTIRGLPVPAPPSVLKAALERSAGPQNGPAARPPSGSMASPPPPPGSAPGGFAGGRVAPARANPVVGANLVQAQHQKQRASRLRWIGGIAVLCVLAAGAYLVTRESSNAVAGSPVPPPVVPPAAARAPQVAPAPRPLHPEPPPPDPTPPAAPTKIRVRIVTHPSDATVLLDGKKLGHTPLDETLDPDPGKHVMKLRHRGYVSQTLEVALDADVTQELTLVRDR
ncbi:MAG TPA: serine/threonine-protein kinase [Kofleriaceae bacterium]|nr:serine/threonine-protein kinase [Kofleriaceae bacterium]